MEIEIPGIGKTVLKHVVFDYNGTLAVEGRIRKNVKSKLAQLTQRLVVHVLTADTFGIAARELEGVPIKLQVLTPGEEAEQKLEYIEHLGAENVIAFGNGNNDELMIKYAAIGVAVIGREGASGRAIAAADIIVTDIMDGLELLENKKRIKATLRF